MRLRVIALILLLSLCGCMQQKSIDTDAYVLNIGVERGSTMPYLVTFLVSVPGDGTETTKVENRVLTAEARTFSEAVTTLNNAYPSRLRFSRSSLLAIGEDLAREGGQSAFLDFSFGKADLWQNLRVAVVKGPIKDVFEGWLSTSDPSLRKIKTTAGELQKKAGTTSDFGFGDYTEAIASRYRDAVIAYAGVNTYGLTEDLVQNDAYPYTGGALLVESILKTSMAGSAVFDGDRMVGVLNGQHTMIVLMVTDAFRRGEVQLTLPDGRELAVTLYRMRKPKLRLSGGSASVTVYLEADPTEPQTIEMDSEQLKSLLQSHLETELMAVFSALQKANSDAMGFGRLAARRFTDTEAWEAYDWKAAYRTLSVTFTVQLKLSHNPRDPILE